MRRTLTGMLALCLLAALPAARANEPDTPKSLADIAKTLKDMDLKLDLMGQRIKADVDSLKSRVELLEKRLEVLQKVRVQESAFPATGTIVLENRLDVPATFIVDSVPYRVAPRDVRSLTSYEARAFTYEILADGYGALQGPVVRTLRANNTFRIWTYLP